MSSDAENHNGSTTSTGNNDDSANDESSFHYIGHQSLSEIPRHDLMVQLIVDDSVRVILDSAFRGLGLLEEVHLGSSLKRIGDEAFAFCKMLKMIAIPASVEVIGEGAFNYCIGLDKVVFAEDGALKKIDDRCYLDCHSLFQITLPNTVTYLGNAAFFRCRKLQTVVLSEGLQAIQSNTFSFCYSLVTIRVPSIVSSIGGAAFSNCYQLASVELSGDNSIAIDRFAFSWCESLVVVTLPKSDSYWGEDVFNNCEKLIESIDDELPTGQIRSDDYLRQALKNRFDLLPIHRICYNLSFDRKQNSYNKSNQGHDRVSEIIKSIESDPDLLTVARTADCCGLTPFHILAISQDLSPTFFLALQNVLLSALVWQADKWGRSSVYYLCRNPSPLAPQLIRILLEQRILDCLKHLGSEQWRLEIRQEQAECMSVLEDTDGLGTDRCEQVRQLLHKLNRYERLEGISILELVLWKAKVNSLLTGDLHNARTKKMLRTTYDLTKATKQNSDAMNMRQNKRDHCGAPIVIPNVLSFLDPLPSSDVENNDLVF